MIKRKIKSHITHQGIGGKEFIVDEYITNRLSNGSILENSQNNMACFNFVLRRPEFNIDFPYKLYYGKVDGLGYIVAEDELELEEYNDIQRQNGLNMTKEEQKKMFDDNINLAYKMASKYLSNYGHEYEDIRQISLLGLWKAILTYDETRNYKFSSYACIVILNDINYYLRSVRKHSKNISINTPIIDIKQNVNIDIVIEDILKEDKNCIDILEDVLTYEELTSYIDSIRNRKHQKIYRLYIKGDVTQRELAKRFNMSQTNISKIIKRTNKYLLKRYIYK